MHREGKDLTRLGMVPDLVTAGEVASPRVRRDKSPGIDIEGKETSKVNVAIGLSILGSFIGALGGGKLGLEVGFNKARTVTFEYAGVMEDAVDVLALEKFVKAGAHQPAHSVRDAGEAARRRGVRRHLGAEDEEDRGEGPGRGWRAVKVDVPVIQQAVGGNLKVDGAGTQESRVAFEGAVPVAFAFQAVQLVFDDSGEFLTTQQLRAGRRGGAGIAAGRRAVITPGARPRVSRSHAARSCASLSKESP